MTDRFHGRRILGWDVTWTRTAAELTGGGEGFTPAEGKTSGQRGRWTSSGQPRRQADGWTGPEGNKRRLSNPTFTNKYGRMDVGGVRWPERCFLVGCLHDAGASVLHVPASFASGHLQITVKKQCHKLQEKLCLFYSEVLIIMKCSYCDTAHHNQNPKATALEKISFSTGNAITLRETQ